MPKIPYKTMKLKPSTLDMIDKANEILDGYSAQGYQLTLRQLYYQFVARGMLENSMRNYKRLGTIIDSGRLCGLIDWDHIEDRTRNLESRYSYADPNRVINAAYSSYHLDRWEKQEYRPEVWIEKEALAGIFERVCRKWDVPFFACRGYTSQSEMWGAAMRLKRHRDQGKQPVILHFGDHDPSGIDMSRDIRDRMSMFGLTLDVNRLALNMDQVDQYSPPPNPAKQTDARFQSYSVQFGDESWELDALEPNVLVALVEDAINGFRNPSTWGEVVGREIEDRALLKATSQKWQSVRHYLEDTFQDRIDDNLTDLRADDDYSHEVEAE